MNDQGRFTQGDCHILARRLHRLTGWPLCAFGWGGPDLHAFVLMPDGRYLDIDGAQTEDELRERWKCTSAISEFDLVDFRAWGGPDFGHHSYARARAAADRLLASVTVAA